MPIIASAGENKSFSPAPEGMTQACCVDVIDLGLMEVTYQGKTKQQHKVNVVWQLSERRDDQKRFLVFKRYTLSLADKANLRHDLESWRGKAFTDAELAGFDLEVLKGVNCVLNIQHRKSVDGSKTYANVVSVNPLMKGMPKLLPEDYARPVPKPEEKATDREPGSDDGPVSDDDITW